MVRYEDVKEDRALDMDRDEQIAYLISIIEQMKETLEFYGNRINYTPYDENGKWRPYKMDLIQHDEGERARKVLKPLKE